MKSVQMVHGEGSPHQPMDSLLKKYWFVHQLGEIISMYVSTRVLGVNPNIAAGLKRRFSWKARDIGTLTVSVNSTIFSADYRISPPNPLKIVFAGRLDAFKRPDLIFKVIDRLHSVHEIPVEFHYIGSSDPCKFEEFTPIKHITVLHGFCRAKRIAEIFGRMHAGLLLSEFEGMPVFALELMSVGRPLVALELPQLTSIIEDGVSGYMVARTKNDETNVREVTKALLRLRSELVRGCFHPDQIRSLIMPYTAHTQMKRLFDIHRQLHVNSGDDQFEVLTT
jgi:glycosyltransferase involved in cell wall biosynthesis